MFIENIRNGCNNEYGRHLQFCVLSFFFAYVGVHLIQDNPLHLWSSTINKQYSVSVFKKKLEQHCSWYLMEALMFITCM